MNLRQLAQANIRRNKLAATLNIVLMAIGIGTVVLLLLFSHHMRERMRNDAQHIDMVIGAKGSPSQLVLSAVYHADVPTGNIDYAEAKRWLAHPLVKQVIPQSLGDSWHGYRIVGTTPAYAELYEASLADGTFWQPDTPRQVVIGADIAAEGLAIGSRFASIHGVGNHGDAHDDEDEKFTVVGVLKPTGRVIDRLILTSLDSIWDVHAEHDDHHGTHKSHANKGHAKHHNEHETHSGKDHTKHHDEHETHSGEEHAKHHDEHEAHSGEEHAKHHDEHETHSGEEHADSEHTEDEQEFREVTNLLIVFKNALGATTLPRQVNAEPGLQAARPAWEMARMQQVMGVGLDAFELVGWLLVLMAGLSVFVMLYQALETRRYDLAMLRCLGATRTQVGLSLLYESLLLTLAGALSGILLGHLVAIILGATGAHASLHGFSGLLWLDEEWLILLTALVVGILAALVPAWRVYRTDIAEVLAQ